jgi:hypothetical protein
MEKFPHSGRPEKERKDWTLLGCLKQIGEKLRAVLVSTRLPVPLDYDRQLKVHLCEPHRFVLSVARLQADGFVVKPQLAELAELSKGALVLRIVRRGSRFHQNMKCAMENPLTASIVDGEEGGIFDDTLRQLKTSLGDDAHVLYVGAGADTSVQSVFPNTLHLDISSPADRIEDINQTTLPDESFDLVVFRFFPYHAFNAQTAQQVIRLLKRDGKVLEGTSRISFDHRELRLGSIGRMLSIQFLLTQAGLKPVDPSILESNKIFEK